MIMLDLFKARMASQGAVQAQAYLHNADMAIDKTFTRDPAYREVYITHMPSGIVNQKMDAKFIIDTRRSLSSDEEVYKLMFRPHIKVPLGSYVDIPDDTGELQRWLIILNDHQPQFPMYYILKCNWVLKWMYEGKAYKCECVQRTQSSYNSGLWTDYNFTSVENQTIMWLPTTPYVQTLSYNQRILINDEGRQIPLAWELSKVLDTIPIGITRLTFKQVQADMHSDCGKFGIANFCPRANKDANDYEACKYCTIAEPFYIDAALQMPIEEPRKGRITYNGKDASLRVGGSAKTFTAEYWNSDSFASYDPFWIITLVDEEVELCSVNAHFNGTSWDISPDKSGFEIATTQNGKICEVRCFVENKDIFKVKLESSGDSLKLSCAQLYNMVGKQMVLSAKDAFGSNEAEIIAEVIS